MYWPKKSEFFGQNLTWFRCSRNLWQALTNPKPKDITMRVKKRCDAKRGPTLFTTVKILTYLTDSLEMQ